MAYKILSLSDTVLDLLYSPQIQRRFSTVDLVVSCGDLPYEYLEYVTSMLNVPLYFVLGNHDIVPETSRRFASWGGEHVHHRTARYHDLLLAGVGGSVKYSGGENQYTQEEMWQHVIRLVPWLWLNRIRFGRYLDVFITHAPPLGINDRLDLPHQGIKAFRWLLDKFKPAVHLHGHVHIYRKDTRTIAQFGPTRVINTYGYAETQIDVNHRSSKLDHSKA